MLELKNIYKKLGDFELKNINLQVNKGEYFVILGPTGTGKTVILELIAGLYQPDQGQLFFRNQNFAQLEPEDRNVGFVYQDYALFPHLTVQENIEFGIKENENTAEVDKLIKMMDIENIINRYPTTLSGGEQQRTAIARAVVTAPNLLLFDEPLSALDPQTKNLFKKELANLHQLLDTTTVHITHDFTEALYLADRIAVMQDGEIVQVGKPAEIFRSPKSTFVANFVGMENIFEGFYQNGKITINDDLEVVTAFEREEGKIKDKNVSAAVRPENIIITKEKIESSARNNFPGKVIDIIDQGALCRLTIDIGLLINVLITNKSLVDLNIDLGDEVWTAFKASAVHVF